MHPTRLLWVLQIGAFSIALLSCNQLPKNLAGDDQSKSTSNSETESEKASSTNSGGSPTDQTSGRENAGNDPDSPSPEDTGIDPAAEETGATLEVTAVNPDAIDKDIPLDIADSSPSTALNMLASSSGSPAFGDAGPADLQILAYYIAAITMCEGVDIPAGTTATNPRGNCITLYNPQQSENKNGPYTFEQARADANPFHYINLLTRPSLRKLNNTIKLTKRDAKEYTAGFAFWEPFIKINGRVKLTDGSAVYTKSNGSYDASHYQTLVSDAHKEPMGTSTVYTGNGGNVFIFQKPFRITEEDIRAGRPLTMTLAFNPFNIVKGFEVNSRTFSMVDKDTQRSILAPMLDLTPVPHKAGELVVRETYLAHWTGVHPVDVRIDIYSLDHDSGKTIYGVNGNYVYTDRSDSEQVGFSKTWSIQTASDGSLSFHDHTKTAFLRNLTRKNMEGGMGNLELACNLVGDQSTCANGWVSVPYELKYITRLE